MKQESSQNDNSWFTPGVWLFPLVMLILPTIVATILYFCVERNLIYFESCFVISGALSLILVLFRNRARDSANYKKNHSIVEDKQSPEYINYVRQQWFLAGASVLILLLSLVFFLIRRFAA